ncbi:MAG: hypothetical protein ABR976_04835 [Terracidiphilus sp.]
MTKTKSLEFDGRLFWVYDVAAGVFLKYLVDEAEASEHAGEAWLSEAVSDWRAQAAITEFGLTLKEQWSSAQRQIFIELSEEACKKLATRMSISSEEIASWELVGDLHISTRGESEILTAPVIELGRAIIELVSGNLPQPPKDEAWFYGLPTGRSTLRMKSGREIY